ncbi:MAG: outer membrane beta-barrel protein [Saprospiraceae bacterium]
MRTTFVIALLAIPLLAFGQKNHSIDFIGSVDYTFRTLQTLDESYNTVITVRNEEEKANIQWRSGFNYNQRISERFYFKSGLRLAVLGYKAKEKQDLIFASDFESNFVFNVDTSYFFTPSPSQIEISSENWFIELPVVFRYEFSKKKFTPFVETGFGVTYLLFRRSIIERNETREVNIINTGDLPAALNRIQMEATLAFGANYKLNNSLQLFAQPTFRYHLTPFWDGEIKERLWSAGLEVGLRKWFN